MKIYRFLLLSISSFRSQKVSGNEIIKDAYVYRSKYIHHGNKSKEDFELLQSLQLAVWTAIYNVVMLKDRFKSQEELLEAIQDQILS